MALPEKYKQKLESMLKRRSRLENEMAELAVTSPEKLQAVGREFSELEHPCSLYTQYLKKSAELAKTAADAESETDREMKTLFREEIASLDEELEKLELEIDEEFTESEEIETRPAMLEIRSGTGGEEAALFAGDLFRMYTRYAENRGWTTETLSGSESARGGFKEVIISISGTGAYNRLKYESGVHRVQRVPITEAGGRIHTSAATVAVLIEPSEVEVEIDPSDLKVDTYRAQGAGGQHVNKTSSAIRITHMPSGIVVECQDERSQHQNRAKAMRLLRARLLDKLEQEQQDKITEDRRNQVGSGDRSERIRTYNFPQNRVSDHRASITLYKLELIMTGELDHLLDPLIQHMLTSDSGDGSAEE